MPNLIRCPNGHFYDLERSSQCPYCDKQSVLPPIGPDCPGEEEFLRRMAEREEELRKLGTTGEIPARDEPAPDRTVSLQEDRTLPLTPDRPSIEELYSRLVEAKDALEWSDLTENPPVQTAKTGWRRGLLIVAAGLAGVCTLLSLADVVRWLL